MMRSDNFIINFVRIAILMALFSPALVSAQALSTEDSCRRLGFMGERKMTPGLLPSMVIRSMDPRIQCGLMFEKAEASKTIKFDPKNDPNARKFLEDVKKQGMESVNQEKVKEYYKQEIISKQLTLLF